MAITNMPKAFGTAAFCAAIGVGAAILAAGTITLVAPSTAQATPAYASQTGRLAENATSNPAGGGPNTAFGKAFAANGHKLPK